MAESDKGGIVDGQHGDRDSGGAGTADKARAVPAKMAAPLLAAGVEQRNKSAALRVDAGDVRPLGTVAEETGQGQVVLGRGAAMLLGDDVVDGEGDGRAGLRQSAILAALACPLADLGD